MKSRRLAIVLEPRLNMSARNKEGPISPKHNLDQKKERPGLVFVENRFIYPNQDNYYCPRSEGTFEGVVPNITGFIKLPTLRY